MGESMVIMLARLQLDMFNCLTCVTRVQGFISVRLATAQAQAVLPWLHNQRTATCLATTPRQPPPAQRAAACTAKGYACIADTLLQ